MVDLRLPNIKGANEREQLKEMQSYMYQLVEQLQFALNTIETSQSVPTVMSQMPARIIPLSPVATMSLEGLSDDQATFQAIKPLIIKSAEIVNAYYEEINRRLEGVYVAQSEYGSFSEQTSQDIYDNSTETNRVFTNLQKIITDIEDINFTLVDVRAHIKSGLLYTENGIPVYGVEVGQKSTLDGVEVFNKYARFTSNKLSFYDKNDTEVAYISDYKLYITHAEVTGTLKLGGYLVDTSKGVTFKWVGRS